MRKMGKDGPGISLVIVFLNLTMETNSNIILRFIVILLGIITSLVSLG